jgi:hypothetical protein
VDTENRTVQPVSLSDIRKAQLRSKALKLTLSDEENAILWFIPNRTTVLKFMEPKEYTIFGEDYETGDNIKLVVTADNDWKSSASRVEIISV